MANISDVVEILKDAYGERVETLNNECFIWDNAMSASSDSFVGLRAVHTIHTKRTSGVGARVDGGVLPTAGNQNHERVYMPMRRTYGRIQLGRPLMRQASTAPGAFVDALDDEMTGCMNDYRRDICRQVWGTSNGVIVALDSNSTVTVTCAATATKYQVIQAYGDGGMLCDIGTVADPDAIADGILVTGYSIATPGAYTITLASAPGTVTSSHYLFRHDAGGASDNSGNDNDGQAELTGLQTAVSTSTTLHTLSTATGGPTWQSTVKSNSGTNRPVTETLIMDAAMAASESSGMDADAAFCNRGVMLALVNMLIATKRHVVNIDSTNTKLKLQAGASGVVLNIPGWGIKSSGMLPVFADRDCPGNKLYGLNFDSIIKYELERPNWVDDDGSVLSRVSGYDAFEAYLAGYQELGHKRRNAHFLIDDLTEASA